MKLNQIFLFAILIWLASAGLLQAQGPATGAPEDYKRERIQDLIIMRLNSELGLNPSQSQQLAQILRKYHQERQELRRRQRELTGQLRTASSGGNEAQIQGLLKQITSTRSQLDQVNDRQFNEIKPLLTPMQQAKYLLVMDEIRQEVKAIRHAPPGPSYAPGFAPGTGNQDAVRVGPPY